MLSSVPVSQEQGAYGLRLADQLAEDLLVVSPPHWPSVELIRSVGSVEPLADEVDDDRARFALPPHGRLEVHKRERRAVFTTSELLSDELLVHPYLAPVAACFARWAGRETLHASAFVGEQGAWAIIGDRGAGKSSAIASLALMGHEVLCDDLLVVDSGMAMAGPRCVDLREDTAMQLQAGAPTRRGPEPRWRLRLGPVAAEHRLAGWVSLAWGQELGIEPIPASDRIAALAPHRSLMLKPPDPVALLDLASLPAFRLTRPRDWTELPAATALLAALHTGAG